MGIARKGAKVELIVHQGRRVLTSTQIAESLATTAKVINRNYQRNADKFQEGTHYYCLKGAELKAFKGERPQDANLKFAASLMLWTEQGTWLHSTFLKSKEAKEAVSALISSYYTILDQPQIQQSQTNLLAITLEDWTLMESRVKTLEERISQVTLHSGEQIRLRKAVSERVYQLTQHQGGARPVLFRAIWSAVKERYDVSTYRDVKQHELQDALRFVEGWGDIT